jgi:hypothetical protein
VHSTWITLDYLGLPWITLDYLGLPWTSCNYCRWRPVILAKFQRTGCQPRPAIVSATTEVLGKGGFPPFPFSAFSLSPIPPLLDGISSVDIHKHSNFRADDTFSNAKSQRGQPQPKHGSEADKMALANRWMQKYKNRNFFDPIFLTVV